MGRAGAGVERAFTQGALGAIGTVNHAARASALHAAGWLAFLQGDNSSANELLEASIGLARQLDDKRGLAEALTHLGNLRMYQGDHTAAVRLHRESVQLLRQTDANWNLAYSLFFFGDAVAIQDHTEARQLYEESLALFRGFGDKWGITYPLTSLGHLAAEKGNYAAARTLLEEGLTLRTRFGRPILYWHFVESARGSIAESGRMGSWHRTGGRKSHAQSSTSAQVGHLVVIAQFR